LFSFRHLFCEDGNYKHSNVNQSFLSNIIKSSVSVRYLFKCVRACVCACVRACVCVMSTFCVIY